MGMSVNTNIASLNAQRNLLKTGNALDLAIQRLSSGLRINSAKDDAAGLAISNRFTSQIEGTNVAIRNSNDAISLAQTGEGALQEYTNILQRIRDLAVQSANDTNSNSDRAALNAEVDQLKDELNRIGQTAEFNGVKLFDGVKTNFTFQTGAAVGDTVDVTLSAVTTDKIGAAQTAGISSQFLTIGSDGTDGLTAGSSTQELNAGDLVINGFAVGASVGSADTASHEFAESSAIAKVAAINEVSETTGVTATVNANRVEGLDLTGGSTAIATTDITINGVDITGIGTTASTTQSGTQIALEGVADAINAKSGATGVRAEVVEGEYMYRIDLIADDGRNISLDVGFGASTIGLVAAGAVEHTFAGTFTLNSVDGGDINLSTDTGFIENAGFAEGNYSGTQATTVSRGDLLTSTAEMTTSALESGDLLINGIAVGPTLALDDNSSFTGESTSAIARAAAVNKVSEQTGVTATVNANVVSGLVIRGSAGAEVSSGIFTMTINGVVISGGGGSGQTQSDQQNDFIDAVNAEADTTGVRAVAVGTGFNLIADDGRNISFNGGASTGIAAAGILFFDPDRAYNSDFSDQFVTALSTTGDATFVGSYTLSSGGPIELTTLTGDIDNAGLRIGDDYGATEEGQLLNQVDISTVAGANAAITAVDNALTQVDRVRGDLGAVQNRFESTVSYLANLSENLSAARSRIRDADFALETSNLTKAQILQQAGTAMLAQANALSQNVLTLLG